MGPQGIIPNSATTTLDEISTHIAHIAAKMKRDGVERVEISKEAEEEYCSKIFEASTSSQKFFAACTPGYYSNEGEVEVGKKTLAANYPGGSPGGGGIPKFLGMLHEMQENDDLFVGYNVQ